MDEVKGKSRWGGEGKEKGKVRRQGSQHQESEIEALIVHAKRLATTKQYTYPTISIMLCRHPMSGLVSSAVEKDREIEGMTNGQ